ncbi:tRNA pseudouridine(13) synthase TruD [Methanosarcinaceae archaeon]|nr:tRNA pseudouridine(13) synthase TruD [Methanosarcinaceae archaeon]
MKDYPVTLNDDASSSVPFPDRMTGVLLYSTETPGLDGVLKKSPEDFVVEEISEIKTGDSGKYLITELRKTNWDTHHFLKAFSKILGISYKRIGLAGTKDKRAVTTQKMSIYDVDASDVENIHMKDIEVRVLGRARNGINLGDLEGNRFEIIVRDIRMSQEEAEKCAAETTEAIRKAGGVPNFFGIQRFGSTRPVTHLVGKDIISGDIKKAAMRYISEIWPDEAEETCRARAYVAETGDLKGAFQRFPDYLGHEKAMLNHLSADPDDAAGAFMTLPKNLCMMFVHAEQSYMFNKIISERLRSGLKLNEAVQGDIVCYRAKDGTPDPSRLERVTEENIDGINNLLRRRRAFVTAPLIGYESAFAEGPMGEIERRILDECGHVPDDFRIPSFPEVASKGMRKEILLEVDPAVEVFPDDSEGSEGKTAMRLTFSLPKGSYATTVLREYMKTDPRNMRSGKNRIRNQKSDMKSIIGYETNNRV